MWRSTQILPTRSSPSFRFMANPHMWFLLRPLEKCDIAGPDFDDTRKTPYKITCRSLISVCRQIGEEIRKLMIEIHFSSTWSRTFHHAEFHETYNKTINVCVHLVYRICSKLDENCRKYGLNFIYVPKDRMFFTAPVFRKFTNAYKYCTKNFVSNSTQSVMEYGKGRIF
jgi:hypothetical protein